MRSIARQKLTPKSLRLQFKMFGAITNKPLLTICFWRDAGGFKLSTVVVLGKSRQRKSLPCGRVVDRADRDSHELYVAVAVPDEQLAAARYISERLVVDLAVTAICTTRPRSRVCKQVAHLALRPLQGAATWQI